MMTNSYRRTPIFGMAQPRAGSMRWYKRLRASRERARLQEALSRGEHEHAEGELAHWNEWDCPRDGKHYRAQATERDMRK